MNQIMSDSSSFPIPTQSASSSPYNFNIKTLFLFIILLCGCCLLSIGYNFEINKVFDFGSISFWACLILTMFLFYVLYEFFKSTDCDNSGKQQFADFSKLSSAMGRGRSYMGQQGTNAMISMGNRMARYNPDPNSNNYSTQLNKYGQPMIPEQYRNHAYTSALTPMS